MSKRIDSHVISYQLIKTTRRLTFDIAYQRGDTIFEGDDDGPYFKFLASNGVFIQRKARQSLQYVCHSAE